MTVLAWILAVVGAALAWIVVLGSSMSTVPKLRMDGVFLASAAPAAGLALAVMEGARSGWGIGLWIPALLAGSALVYVWLAMFTQPSPPDWVRAARRALRLGGGSRARRTVRLAHADGQLELDDAASAGVFRGFDEFFSSHGYTTLSRPSCCRMIVCLKSSLEPASRSENFEDDGQAP